MTDDQNTRIRPIRILASYVMDADNVPQRYSDELHQLATTAARALTNAGDNVQVWCVNAPELPAPAKDLVDRVDGLLLLGGVDVDPARYTSDPAAAALVDTSELNPAADENEIALLGQALAAGIPVLGICRGAQLINVALGGTLITDLGNDTMHNTRPDGDDMSDHAVILEAGTRIAEIYGRAQVDVRSAHHQAVDTIAPALRITARASDGVIEAFEAADERWLLGVQWHPEDVGGNPDDLKLLTDAFVGAIRHTTPPARQSSHLT